MSPRALISVVAGLVPATHVARLAPASHPWTHAATDPGHNAQ